MKLETFIILINGIRKREKELKRLGRFIGKYNSSHTVLQDKVFIDLACDLIVSEMGEQAWDYVSWWLWETCEKAVYRGSKRLIIDNPTTLFFFINEGTTDLYDKGEE
jgi:hypothetical protein